MLLHARPRAEQQRQRHDHHSAIARRINEGGWDSVLRVACDVARLVDDCGGRVSWKESGKTQKPLARGKSEGDNVERSQPERELPEFLIVEHRADHEERQKKYLAAESDQLN